MVAIGTPRSGRAGPTANVSWRLSPSCDALGALRLSVIVTLVVFAGIPLAVVL